MNTIYYTPGPAALYPTVTQHLQKAISEHIPSMSHRSSQFRALYQSVYEGLKELLDLPAGYGIFFLGSATEIWERILQNCVEKDSFHLVNGAFSRKFYDFAGNLQKQAHKQEVAFGQGFAIHDIQVPESAEMIAFTQNETSSGVATPLETIHAIKEQYPNKLVVVDAVSSAPYPEFDFTKIDSAFFSVQKAFGLPAGLGVWIAHEKCLEKAKQVASKGHITGTFNQLPNLWKFFEKFETPATPNVLTIYLLDKVIQDMLKVGKERIRQETDLKAIMLYDFLRESEQFDVFVENPDFQSNTVIVANTRKPARPILEYLAQKGLIVGSGYDKSLEQIRIANFPATSVEQIEILIEAMGQ
jgi:phosphoserine aminotransferase